MSLLSHVILQLLLCRVSMELLEQKISSHNAEAPDIVLELKAELDTLHDKLEVVCH